MNETTSIPMLFGVLGLVFVVFGILMVLAYRSASKPGRHDWVSMLLVSRVSGTDDTQRMGALIIAVGIVSLLAAAIDAFNLYGLLFWLN